jgi:TonB family protein
VACGLGHAARTNIAPAVWTRVLLGHPRNRHRARRTQGVGHPCGHREHDHDGPRAPGSDIPSPPPRPKFTLVRPTIDDLGPPPGVPLDVGPDPNAIHTEAPVVVPTPSQPPPALVKRVLGGPGKGFPNSDDYYPPAARRLGEQGNTAIQVCVDPNGQLTADPEVTQSSGSVRLDEGAVRLAKAGSGHYRATTENGTPVSSCYGYLIRFKPSIVCQVKPPAASGETPTCLPQPGAGSFGRDSGLVPPGQPVPRL